MYLFMYAAGERRVQMLTEILELIQGLRKVIPKSNSVKYFQ